MNFQVEIGFNAAALSAISDLTAAIRGLQPQTTVVSGAVTGEQTKPAATSTAKKSEPESAAPENDDPVTIYWFDSASDEVGTVEGEEAFKALKKKRAKAVKWTESKYKAKLAEQEAAANAETEEVGEDEVPTQQDLIKAFSAYLPAEMEDGEEREARRSFVKAMLQRFGARKASEIAEQHRKLAINLVERKIAGQDVDPTSSKFAEICAEIEAEDESLV
mgnify:CR=1 FL=1